MNPFQTFLQSIDALPIFAVGKHRACDAARESGIHRDPRGMCHRLASRMSTNPPRSHGNHCDQRRIDLSSLPQNWPSLMGTP